MQMFRLLLFYFSIFNVLDAREKLLNEILPLSDALRPSHYIGPVLKNATGFNAILISKTMSQTTLLTLCDLLRQQRGLPEKNLIVGKDKNLCMRQNWYHRVPSKHLNWIVKGNSPALIVVRDPIERFVSMYAYLCKEKHLCPRKMNIHRFAKWTNELLLEMVMNEKDRYKAVLGHIQPSFWFAYENGKSLPEGGVDFVFQSLDRKTTANQFERIFVKRGVPPRVAHRVTDRIRKRFINSKREKRGQTKAIKIWTTQVLQRKETLIYVLRNYYNDYRLLKLELKPQLLAALQRHKIKLPDELMPTMNGGAVLKDDCFGSRLTAAPEKSIPRNYCDL